MIGVAMVTIFLVIYVLIQHKNLKKSGKDRMKVYILSIITFGVTLFLILPYSPSIIVESSNNLFGNMIKMVTS